MWCRRRGLFFALKIRIVSFSQIDLILIFLEILVWGRRRCCRLDWAENQEYFGKTGRRSRRIDVGLRLRRLMRGSLGVCLILGVNATKRRGHARIGGCSSRTLSKRSLWFRSGGRMLPFF